MPKLNEKFTEKSLVLFAMFLHAVVFAWMAYSIFIISSMVWYSVGTFVYGICFILINSLSVPLALEYIKPDQINIGSGMSMMIRWIGSALGAPIMAAIFALRHATSSSYAYALANNFIIMAILLFVVFVLGLIFIKQKQV